MATNTRTRRQASAKKAAATRKENATRRSASATKSSARRTGSSARSTGRAAKSTARQSKRTTTQAARTGAAGLDAATTRLEALGRQAERALMIQIGAATALRDAVVSTAQTYSNLDRVVRELNNFERRGERVVKGQRRTLTRRRSALEHEMSSVGRDLQRQANGLRADADDVVERVKRLA